MQSLFEKNGGTYRREGDYLIPNISVPDTKEYNIGKYGNLHKKLSRKIIRHITLLCLCRENCSIILKKSI